MARGKVHGVANLVDCQQVTHQELRDNAEKHAIDDLSIIKYPKPYAWILSDAVRFDPPIPHLPKLACRMWMNLEYPNRTVKMEQVYCRAMEANLEDLDLIKKLADEANISFYPSSRIPYFRVTLKDYDMVEKFYYAKGDWDGMKAALDKAFQLVLEVARARDEVACFQAPDLKAWLEKRALPKTGSADVLRKRVASCRIREFARPCSATAAASKLPVPEEKQPDGCLEHADSANSLEKGSSPDHSSPDKPPEGPTVQMSGGPMRCKFFAPS